MGPWQLSRSLAVAGGSNTLLWPGIPPRQVAELALLSQSAGGFVLGPFHCFTFFTSHFSFQGNCLNRGYSGFLYKSGYTTLVALASVGRAQPPTG